MAQDVQRGEQPPAGFTVTWDGELDLTRCALLGKAKDAARHTHACILFSTEKTPLKSEKYTARRHAKGNEASIDADLDELDRMSVRLHQLICAEAGKRKKSAPMHYGDIGRVKINV